MPATPATPAAASETLEQKLIAENNMLYRKIAAAQEEIINLKGSDKAEVDMGMVWLAYSLGVDHTVNGTRVWDPQVIFKRVVEFSRRDRGA